MGAWIETISCEHMYNRKTVAPCMGAWIETYSLELIGSLLRRTLYGCVD